MQLSNIFRATLLVVLAALVASDVVTLAPDSGASQCTGITFTVPDKFEYTVTLDELTSECASSVRLTKFYIQGACLNKRDNQIGLSSYQDLTCTEAKSTDPSTCQAVFSQGPSDAFVNGSSLTVGQSFDTDNVCANQSQGYIFVQSNCSSSATVGVTLKTQSYDGPVCLNIAGTHLSGWAIAIIVIAGFIALVLLSWVFWCCCCGSCCCL